MRLEDEFEPVRLAIIDLGVPTTVVTAQVTVRDRDGARTMRHPVKTYHGLQVKHFKSWASGPHGRGLLFDSSLPKNAKGFEMVGKAWPTQVSDGAYNPQMW